MRETFISWLAGLHALELIIITGGKEKWGGEGDACADKTAAGVP